MAADRNGPHENSMKGIAGSASIENRPRWPIARELEGETAFAHAAQEIFLLTYFDGDGFITREEWAGQRSRSSISL